MWYSCWGTRCEIALCWMPQNFINGKSTLVQVMAWCHQATSHYLSQCWPRSLSPYGVTRRQRVKNVRCKSSCHRHPCLLPRHHHHIHFVIPKQCSLGTEPHIRVCSSFSQYSQVPSQCGIIYHDITRDTAITVTESESDIRITTDTTYLALMGELLWGFGRKLTAL